LIKMPMPFWKQRPRVKLIDDAAERCGLEEKSAAKHPTP